MSQTLNMAFVGCGAIARYHLDGLLEHATNVCITACVDPDPDKAQAYAAETGGQAFTSLKEALKWRRRFSLAAVAQTPLREKKWNKKLAKIATRQQHR